MQLYDAAGWLGLTACVLLLGAVALTAPLSNQQLAVFERLATLAIVFALSFCVGLLIRGP